MGLKPCAESSSLFAFEASFSGVTFYKCPNCRGFQPVFSRTTRAAFSKFRPFFRDVSKIGVKTLGLSPRALRSTHMPHFTCALRRQREFRGEGEKRTIRARICRAGSCILRVRHYDY